MFFFFNSRIFLSYRVPVIHRRQLRPSREQPSTTGGHRESPEVHFHRKNQALWRRPLYHQGPRQHGHRHRYRGRQRRNPGAGVRPQLGNPVGEFERPTLLPVEQHHPHHRRQRDHNLHGPGLDFSAPPRHEEHPKRSQLGLPGWKGEGLLSSLHGRVISIRPALVRIVQSRFSGRAEGLVGVPEG